MSKKIDIFSTLERITISSYLENTRMLFDFMDELNRRWTEENNISEQMYNGEGGLVRRANILNALEMWIEDNLKKSDMGELYQNPLSGYIRFYLKLFSLENETPKNVAKHITPMLNYFNVLNYLTNDEEPCNENPDFSSSLPYYFDDLCLTIMQLSECESCTILYRQNKEQVNIVARNGAIEDSNDMIAGVNMLHPEFDSVIRAYGVTDEALKYTMTTANGAKYDLSFSECSFLNGCVNGIKTVTVQAEPKTFGNKKYYHDFLVFEFPYFESEEEDKAKRSFYLLLDYKERLEKNKPNLILPQVHKILFLRNKLWTAIDDNYSKLIQMRFDCSYIKSLVHNKVNAENSAPLDKEHKPEDKEQRTSILHVSDIHLINENKWNAPCGAIVKSIKKAVSNQKGKVDLLAITGDIVNASSNASDAQEKYGKAAALLKELAIALWGQDINEKIILPHDWRRRILVVPGNHDYSAMSDVVVETYSRKIKSGSPATRSGGTMSKLTYYIEFLVNFLDAPVEELLENDMNEIRDYHGLNVMVGLFNSVSKVNSLQNNKVALNEEKLERLIYSKKWSSATDKGITPDVSVGRATEEKNKKTRFVLMHHSPEYRIDYFADKYEPYNYTNIDNIYNEYCKLLFAWLDDKEMAISEYAEEFRMFKNQINTDSYDPKFLRTELYADMNMLIKIYEGTIPDDEFYADFTARHKTTQNMQQEDNKQFLNICQKHIKKEDIVLAGHVHTNRYEKSKDKDEELFDIYVAPKLYDGGRKRIVYSVVSENIHKDQYQTIVHWYDLNGDGEKTKCCPCGRLHNINGCNGNCCI